MTRKPRVFNLLSPHLSADFLMFPLLSLGCRKYFLALPARKLVRHQSARNFGKFSLSEMMPPADVRACISFSQKCCP
jgi:hypothetical protein